MGLRWRSLEAMLNEIVDFLNKAIEQDSESVDNVFRKISIPATQEMVDHPTIAVTMDNELRLVGLINGFIGEGGDRLAMTIDDETGKIIGFCAVTPEGKMVEQKC